MSTDSALRALARRVGTPRDLHRDVHREGLDGSSPDRGCTLEMRNGGAHKWASSGDNVHSNISSLCARSRARLIHDFAVAVHLRDRLQLHRPKHTIGGGND